MPEEPGAGLPPDDAENAQPKNGGKGGASNKMMLIIVAVAAIALAFAVSNFVLKPMLSKNKTAQVVKQPEAKPVEKETKSHGEEGPKEGEAQTSNANIFKIEGIVVNPAATGGSRYLSTTIALELEDPASMDAFRSQEIKIRDALISILSSKTVAELSDAQSRELIRRQILKYINQICQPEKADAVYFVDFVLQ